MIGHVYGRSSLTTNPERPHVFNCELGLYLDYLRREWKRFPVTSDPPSWPTWRSSLPSSNRSR